MQRSPGNAIWFQCCCIAPVKEYPIDSVIWRALGNPDVCPRRLRKTYSRGLKQQAPPAGKNIITITLSSGTRTIPCEVKDSALFKKTSDPRQITCVADGFRNGWYPHIRPSTMTPLPSQLQQLCKRCRRTCTTRRGIIAAHHSKNTSTLGASRFGCRASES